MEQCIYLFRAFTHFMWFIQLRPRPFKLNLHTEMSENVSLSLSMTESFPRGNDPETSYYMGTVKGYP